MEILKGKTTSGFEYEIPMKRLKNFELVEAIAEEETDPTAVVKVVNLLLGNAAKDLKEHVRDEDGIVDVEAIGVEIKEIFDSQKDLKN
ncbi:TPA: hypothetical protein TT580_000298 [Streptococcus equi subsp. zooepidemicus]|nr:hypothetical protein [Streptococcus equi subsp. zooepidemicus]